MMRRERRVIAAGARGRASRGRAPTPQQRGPRPPTGGRLRGVPTPHRVRMKRPKLNTWNNRDIHVPPQMRAAHPTGIVRVRSRQGTPPRASNPSAVGVHRIARRRLRRPAAPAAVRLGNVGAEVEGRQIAEHPIAVAPLIGDQMTAVSPSVTAATASRSSAAAVTVRRSWSYRPDRHPGPPTIARLHGNRVLGLMREMRAPVFHLGDARVGVVRMPPVRIGPSSARPIRGPGPRASASRYLTPVRAASETPDTTAARCQGSVSFERRRVDPDRCALDEIGRRQHLQDPREDGVVGFQIEQAPRPRDRRMRVGSSRPSPRNPRSASESAPAMPRSESRPSKYPIKSPEVGPRQQADGRSGRRTSRIALRRRQTRAGRAPDSR